MCSLSMVRHILLYKHDGALDDVLQPFSDADEVFRANGLSPSMLLYLENFEKLGFCKLEMVSS